MNCVTVWQFPVPINPAQKNIVPQINGPKAPFLSNKAPEKIPAEELMNVKMEKIQETVEVETCFNWFAATYDSIAPMELISPKAGIRPMKEPKTTKYAWRPPSGYVISSASSALSVYASGSESEYLAGGRVVVEVGDNSMMLPSNSAFSLASWTWCLVCWKGFLWSWLSVNSISYDINVVSLGFQLAILYCISVMHKYCKDIIIRNSIWQDSNFLSINVPAELICAPIGGWNPIWVISNRDDTYSFWKKKPPPPKILEANPRDYSPEVPKFSARPFKRKFSLKETP